MDLKPCYRSVAGLFLLENSSIPDIPVGWNTADPVLVI